MSEELTVSSVRESRPLPIPPNGPVTPLSGSPATRYLTSCKSDRGSIADAFPKQPITNRYAHRATIRETYRKKPVDIKQYKEQYRDDLD